MKFLDRLLRWRPRRVSSAVDGNMPTEGGSMPRDDENAAATTAVATAASTGSVSVGGEEKLTDGPPIDDCCPICFDTFVVPCRATCGHWFCGGCILRYWNYCSVSAIRPCKCPMCFRQITKLTPEASLLHRKEQEGSEILKNICNYNRLFVGGAYGLILKVLELPLLVKRSFQGLLDPDRANAHLFKLRLFAILLGALYTVSPFDFLPTAHLSAIDLFDYLAYGLAFVLYLVGLYCRQRRVQRVRELGAIQHFDA